MSSIFYSATGNSNPRALDPNTTTPEFQRLVVQTPDNVCIMRLLTGGCAIYARRLININNNTDAG